VLLLGAPRAEAACSAVAHIVSAVE